MSTKVSHTLTVTETSSSTMSSISFNIAVLKTPTVLLKLLQTISASINLGLMIDQLHQTDEPPRPEGAFLFMVVFAFLIPTFLLLVSSLVSQVAANTIHKTIFEFLYHLSASIFYLAGAINFLQAMATVSRDADGFAECTAMVVLGVLSTILYFASTYFSFRLYRSS